MIKSKLAPNLASRNPHLYQRELERIVNIVLDEIVSALQDGAGSDCGTSVRSQRRSAVLAGAVILAPALLSSLPLRRLRHSSLSRRCGSISMRRFMRPPDPPTHDSTVAVPGLSTASTQLLSG